MVASTCPGDVLLFRQRRAVRVDRVRRRRHAHIGNFATEILQPLQRLELDAVDRVLTNLLALFVANRLRISERHRRIDAQFLVQAARARTRADFDALRNLEIVLDVRLHDACVVVVLGDVLEIDFRWACLRTPW